MRHRRIIIITLSIIHVAEHRVKLFLLVKNDAG